jgi:hypothetical protein
MRRVLADAATLCMAVSIAAAEALPVARIGKTANPLRVVLA